MRRPLLTAIIALAAVSNVAASEICVSRSENSGVINIRPTHIIIDGKADFSVTGGERKCRSVNPGNHLIVAQSPHPYDPSDKKTWESQPLQISVPAKETVEISVEPISSGAEYIGPWQLKEILSNKRMQN